LVDLCGTDVLERLPGRWVLFDRDFTKLYDDWREWQGGLGGRAQVFHGMDAGCMKPHLHVAADTREVPVIQGMQDAGQFIVVDDEQPVGLAHLAGDLGQVFVGAAADAHNLPKNFLVHPEKIRQYIYCHCADIRTVADPSVPQKHKNKPPPVSENQDQQTTTIP